MLQRPPAVRHTLARALLRDFHRHFPDDPARERDVYCRADDKRYQEVLQRLPGHTWESASNLA